MGKACPDSLTCGKFLAIQLIEDRLIAGLRALLLQWVNGGRAALQPKEAWIGRWLQLITASLVPASSLSGDLRRLGGLGERAASKVLSSMARRQRNDSHAASPNLKASKPCGPVGGGASGCAQGGFITQLCVHQPLSSLLQGRLTMGHT